MSINLFQLSDAIVEEINKSSYDESFNASTNIPMQTQMRDIRDLQVRVIPISADTTNHTRGSRIDEVIINVGVQKKLEEVDVDTKVRELHILVAKIHDSLVRKSFGDYCYLHSTIDPVFDVESLLTSLVFSSVINLTYRIVSSVQPERL